MRYYVQIFCIVTGYLHYNTSALFATDHQFENVLKKDGHGFRNMTAATVVVMRYIVQKII